MKRGIVSTSLVVLVLLVGSACAASVGDGNLADDWATMADPKIRVPEAARCYVGAARGRDPYTPNWYRSSVPCTDPHTAETFHVGQLPAEVSAPPEYGDRDYWAAFDACETQSKTFLGGDWYAARLYLTVFVPTTQQWEAGARWFACQLVEIGEVVLTTAVRRSGSLQNGLTGAAAVAHRCTNVIDLTEDSWGDMTPVDCAQPHDAEFAGAFKVSGLTPPTGDKRKTTLDECWNVVARYLGGTRGRIQMGYIPWGMEPTDWKRGDRWVRCFAWSFDHKTRGSAKGLGNRTPPK